MYYRSMIIWYVSCLHLLWAFIVWSNDTAVNVTSTYGLNVVFGSWLVPVLVISSLLPFIGFFIGDKVKEILFMLPQQSLLFISAFVALRAIWLGQFPDGVTRSPWFIAADQSPAILIFVFYSITIIVAATTDRNDS